MKNLLIPVIVIAVCSLNFANAIQYKSAEISTDRVYILALSDLKYLNTSEAYANSIFTKVKSIIYSYLRYPIQPIEDEKSTLLSLLCTIKRHEDIAGLSVVIQDCGTHEVYLEQSYTASFFAPNELLRDFSASFPEAFKLPIVNEYEYKPKNKGYSAGVASFGFMLGDLFYPDGRSLVYNLSKTENPPTKLMDEINAFALRRNIEAKTGEFSFLMSSIFLVIAVGCANQSGGKVESSAPLVFGTIAGVSFGISVVSCIVMVLDVPFGIVRKLNDWVSNRAHTQEMKPEEGRP